MCTWGVMLSGRTMCGIAHGHWDTEGGAGEVRHGQPDGDQPAGVEIIHVGGLLSSGLEARDGLTDCRPPLSRLSPLSAAAPGSFRQGMTLAHLTWL